MSCLLMLKPLEVRAGDLGYTPSDARDFYYQTNNTRDNQMGSYAGNIYMATQAKTASSSSVLRYRTVGFDIKLVAPDNTSVSFDLKRNDSRSSGGSVRSIDSDANEDGYTYELYKISLEDIRGKAYAVDRSKANKIFGYSSFDVYVENIVATFKGDTDYGDITSENSDGTINYTGTIYHCNDGDDRSTLASTFSHNFENYHNQFTEVLNPTLTVYYNANYGTVGNGYSTNALNTNTGATGSAAGDSSTPGFIPSAVYKNGSLYREKYTIYNVVNLLNDSTLGMSKTGYHLRDGKEWVFNFKFLDMDRDYNPQELYSDIVNGDASIFVKASWDANEYTVHYNSNGGAGSISSTKMEYDSSKSLSKNIFSRTGYEVEEGKEWVDGSGNIYGSSQRVKNLTSVNGGSITMYSNWVPSVYRISLDGQGATTSGTTEYYEKYDNGNYSSRDCSNALSSITVPSRTGYTFGGYFTEMNGKGTCYVDSSGNILSKSNTFTCDTKLYAYWIVNKYTIVYNPNGGTGTMNDTTVEYDTYFALRYNTFYQTGFDFKGWSTTPDGEVVYEDKAYLINLSSKNGDVINLYAVWDSIVINIDLDKQGGGGGTDNIYQKYGKGFYGNEGCTSSITSIMNPNLLGYTMKGYFERMEGVGDRLIDPTGKITMSNRRFLVDSTIYADWEPNRYKLTFDKQGGTSGTDSVEVVYDSLLPYAQSPVRTGYSFKGYFTKTGGKGTMYYNEYMASDVIWKNTKDLTVYAHWVDETPPQVGLEVSSDIWTNSVITLTVTGKDSGSGLSSVVLYRVDDKGNSTEVSSKKSLNGTTSQVTFNYNNPTEGVIRYRAVATDMAGLVSEVYRIVYYDKTPPSGRVISYTINKSGMIFNIDVTDVNIK